MKFLAGLLVSLAISSTFALPARTPDGDAEVLSTGPRRSSAVDIDDDAVVEPDFKNFDGVVDTGAGYPFFSPVPHNFGLSLGFFDSFEDVLRRLRTRFWGIPDDSAESDEEGTGGFPLAIPAKGGNTTSVVKVVDGHKVEINDTVYGDEKAGSVFKVRVINIRPIESDEATTNGPSPTDDETKKTDETVDKGSPEVMEKSDDNNEINGNIDDPESTETHDTTTTNIPPSTHQKLIHTRNAESLTTAQTHPINNETEDSPPSTEGPLEDFAKDVQLQNLQNEDLQVSDDERRRAPDSDEDEMIEIQNSKKSYSIETYAPKYLSYKTAGQQQSKPVRYQALRDEFSSEEEEPSTSTEKRNNYEHKNSELESFEDDNNELDNDIDNYDDIPVDLSNDIAVNDILADQGAPFEPEAEIFNPNEFVPEGERSSESSSETSSSTEDARMSYRQAITIK